MEFLMYLLAAISLFIVWKKPQYERAAFGIFWIGAAMSIVLFIIAASSSWIPGINL